MEPSQLPASALCTQLAGAQLWLVEFEFDNFKQLYFLTFIGGQSPGHWYNVGPNNK